MRIALFAGCALLGVLLLVAVVLLVRARRRRRASRAVEAALRASSRGCPPSVDASSIGTQIERALADALGRDRPRWRRQRGAALPRYLVLGEAQSGKRSLAAGAGLQYAPRAQRDACWLAREALLVIVPSPQPDEQAPAPLVAALEVLRRVRARHPLDGVLACVDVGVLLGDEAALDACAQALCARLATITERLGARPPVYVVLTRCDRIAGFAETFALLAPGERRQPWGFALPGNDDDVRDGTVPARLARLVQVLERRAITTLAESHTHAACARMYGLPAAVAALGAPLERLLAAASPRDARLGAPLLRGVYLTGVVTECVGATRSDPLATARVTPAPSERLFVRDLLARAVLPDAGLARPCRTRARARRHAALATGLALGVLAGSFACFEVRGYLHGRRLLGALQQALARARAAQTAASLEPLRQSVNTLAAHARDGVPAAYGVALYPGHALRSDAERLYASIVRRKWIEPYLRNVSDALSAASGRAAGPGATHADAYARNYVLLERYLRWTRDAGEAPPRTASSDAWLREGLHAALPGAPGAHLDSYLALVAERPELAVMRDARVVAEARARLRRMPSASLAIDRLEAQLASQGGGVDAESLLGASGLPLRSSHAVPHAFTRRAWEARVRSLLEAPPDALIGASWVLSEGPAATRDAARAARVCALRAAYFERYVAAWRALLGGLRMATPRDGGETLATLAALTHGEPPPLARLAAEVAHHAQLDPRPPEAEAPEAGLLERLEQSLGSTARASGHAPDAPLACPGQAAADPSSVLAALRGFARFASGDERAPASTAAPPVTASQRYHEQLAYVRDALSAHRLDAHDAAPLLERLATAEAVTRQLIDAQEIGWRPRFEALLAPPLAGARASTSGDLARQRAASWCTSVVQPFVEGLAGRYPFDASGQDASLADLAAFYRPRDGQLWSSYEALWARDVPRTGERFALHEGAPLARRYRAQLPVFLARSHAITAALFEAPEGGPRVELEVRVRPTPGVASIVLEVDGQRVDFHNGPERWVPLRWPGDGGARGASLRVRGVGIDETIAQEGEWGIFRLIDSGAVAARAGERSFSVRFRLRTQHDVVVDLRPARGDHPLLGKGERPLAVFRAPGVEVPRDVVAGAKGCR